LGHARGIRPYPNARVWSVVAVSGNCRIQDLTCGLRAIKISRCTLSFSDYLIYCLLRKKTNPILWPPQRAYDHVCPKVRKKVILLKAFDFMNHYSIFPVVFCLQLGQLSLHPCVCLCMRVWVIHCFIVLKRSCRLCVCLRMSVCVIHCFIVLKRSWRVCVPLFIFLYIVDRSFDILWDFCICW
jgi:hypothetical protein